MDITHSINKDWKFLTTFFPEGWQELATQTGATKGLRQDKGTENLMRVALMHVGAGLSMRETVAWANQAQLAQLSDVAFYNRLKKCEPWFHALCSEMFAEVSDTCTEIPSKTYRIVDSTVVNEPGPTGSRWRLHYALSWPKWGCDYLEITPVKGVGNGESLSRYPLKQGDHALGDRNYCRAKELHYADEQNAKTLVRLNPDGIRIESADGRMFDLLDFLKKVPSSPSAIECDVWIPYPGKKSLQMRLCVLRKSEESAQKAQKKLRQNAKEEGWEVKESSLEYARYVMVLTTYNKEEYPTSQVLEVYRFRWQIELVFKRFKQLLSLGHLPKTDPISSQSWLYGKMFTALLIEKIIRDADSFPPRDAALQRNKEKNQKLLA
jgi:hypothetical protein